MFEKHAESGYRRPIEGVEQKTLVYGEKTLMTKFLLSKGATIPRHFHPHEQIGYIIEGHVRFFVGEEEMEVRTGDSWCIPGDVAHGVKVLEDSVIIEVFSPVREEYLP